MTRTPFASTPKAEEERARLIDEAVRAFRRDNEWRWPCACIGCVITIQANYRALLQEAEGVT